VGAVIHLLDKAGARRIRVVEGAWVWPAPLEEIHVQGRLGSNLLLGAAPRVELVNTNMPYKGASPTPALRCHVPATSSRLTI